MDYWRSPALERERRLWAKAHAAGFKEGVETQCARVAELEADREQRMRSQFALQDALTNAEQRAIFWEHECHLLRQEDEAMRRKIEDNLPRDWGERLLGAADTPLPLVPPKDGPPDDPAALNAAAREPVREAHRP
jgi:hypothetical protein